MKKREMWSLCVARMRVQSFESLTAQSLHVQAQWIPSFFFVSFSVITRQNTRTQEAFLLYLCHNTFKYIRQFPNYKSNWFWRVFFLPSFSLFPPPPRIAHLIAEFVLFSRRSPQCLQSMKITHPCFLLLVGFCSQLQ